ncbi:MAG TPA: alpha/beta fold hydrolase [Candidatus Saccharimonadales bacterium]|nr:alpha/beta fold hydrolase [Candidatus Saccharimonadales bacterium]
MPPQRPPHPRLRLICLPYLAGGAAAFRGWAEALGPDIEVLPVQLPGRGPRIREPALTSIPSIVGALATGLSGEFHGSYALFGYSMGAIVAFELTRLLIRERLVPPRHLIVAAHPAPEHASTNTEIYRLPDEQLVEQLKVFGGMPDQFGDDAELQSLLLPIMRADMRALETYVYRPGEALRVPITAIGGTDDSQVTDAEIRAWGGHTLEAFRAISLTGPHFFIHTDPEQLFDVLRPELMPLLAG